MSEWFILVPILSMSIIPLICLYWVFIGLVGVIRELRLLCEEMKK